MFGTAEPDVYFYGKTLEKIGREKYKITSGGFTTCVQPTPRWQLTSGTVLLNLEKLRHSHQLAVQGEGRAGAVPADLLLPVNKEDRATGLPDPDLRNLHDARPDASATRSSGRSAAARTRRCCTTGTRRPARAWARNIATWRSPGSDGQIRFYNLREHEAEYTDDNGAIVDHAGAPQLRGARDDVAAARAASSARAAGPTTSRTSRSSRPTTRTSTTRRAARASTAARSPAPSAAWNLSGAFDRNEFFYGTTQSTVRGGTPKIIGPAVGQAALRVAGVLLDGRRGRQLHRPAQDRDQRRRQRALAVRHLPARAPAVHEVAVPHGLDHRRGPLHLLDRAAGPGHGAQPRRPDQPQLLRAGGAGERARPSTESGTGRAAGTPRRSSTPSSRTSTCSGSRRSTTSPSSCRSTASTRSSARSPA